MSPSLSTTTTRLGIACISVSVMSRSRCSCISRCVRSVTSFPPATMLITRPVLSVAGALPHSITRRLALCVREDVLVVRRREVRRGGPETLEHRLPLVVADEDVPEEAAAKLLLVVEPARCERGAVLVQDAAIGSHHDEQARSRVGDRLEEEELRAQLRLQSHVLEREPRSGSDEVDERGLRVERRVVNERGDRRPVPLDHRDRPFRRADGLLYPATVLVDPAIVVDESVDDLERRVVQRVGERVTERDACVEREQDAGRGSPVEAAAQDARQKA